MSESDKHQNILEAIKLRHLSGSKSEFRPYLQKLWDGSHARCPYLVPVNVDRYAAFQIAGLKSNEISNVVWIDPQLEGLKLGFEKRVNLRNFPAIDFSDWARRGLTGVMWSGWNDDIFEVIVDAYTHICSVNELYWENRNGNILH